VGVRLNGDAADGVVGVAAGAESDDCAAEASPSSGSSEAAGEDDEEAFMKMGIPFGPFLALAALEYIFVGRAFMQWVTAGALP
jgi:prepilin signal peptidase PulO-like enzyme (type II secretory pathway)